MQATGISFATNSGRTCNADFEYPEDALRLKGRQFQVEHGDALDKQPDGVMLFPIRPIKVTNIRSDAGDLEAKKAHRVETHLEISGAHIGLLVNFEWTTDDGVQESAKLVIFFAG
jgi:hypothetical protein